MTRRMGARGSLVRALALVALGFAALTVSATASVADDEPSGFVVLAPEALEARDGKFTGTFTLVNGTPERLAVSVTPVVIDDAGAALDADVEFTAGSSSIPAGEYAQVAVSVTAPASGTVVVTAVNVSRQVIAVVEHAIATSTTPSPLPAVNEWEFTNDLLNGEAHSQIPLKSVCDPAWPGMSVTLAGDGRSVQAKAKCAAGVLDLTVPDASPGLYKGALKLSDTDTVAITMTRTPPMWLAIVLTLAGAAAAWWAGAQLNLIQPIAQRRTRQTELDAGFKSALSTLVTKLREEGKTPPEVVKALEGTSARQAADLPHLETEYKRPLRIRFFAAIPTARFTAVTAELDSIAKDEGLLPELAEKLTALHSIKAELSAKPYASEVADYPLVVSAASYLRAEDRPPFRGQSTVADVQAITRVLATLQETRTAGETILRRVNHPLGDADRAVLFAALTKAEEVALAIGAADDAQVVLDSGIVKTLRRIQANTAALNAIGSAAQPQLTGRDATVAATSGAPVSVSLEWPSWEQLRKSLSTAAVPLLNALGRSPNWLLFGIALTAALLTGYAAFYAGKPWGSPIDIIAAFVYGATTLAASLSLSTYLGDLGEPRRTAAADPSAKGPAIPPATPDATTMN
jgi:hypothetical protein